MCKDEREAHEYEQASKKFEKELAAPNINALEDFISLYGEERAEESLDKILQRRLFKSQPESDWTSSFRKYRTSSTKVRPGFWPSLHSVFHAKSLLQEKKQLFCPQTYLWI